MAKTLVHKLSRNIHRDSWHRCGCRRKCRQSCCGCIWNSNGYFDGSRGVLDYFEVLDDGDFVDNRGCKMKVGDGASNVEGLICIHRSLQAAVLGPIFEDDRVI